MSLTKSWVFYSCALLWFGQSHCQTTASESTATGLLEAPDGASAPIPESFVSFSIEFAFFPDFAGNLSAPNDFSDNLLNSIASLIGTKPHIRVGGNTQDYALYNASLQQATFGIVDPSKSPDYPTTLQIGTSYFESYRTWPDVKYIHGFNLGKNSTSDHQRLLETVPLVCRALGEDKLLYWELGNEPDLFKTSAQGIVRPANWTESDYVKEWLKLTDAIKAEMSQDCPDLVTPEYYQYIAPSFAGTANSLSPVKTWDAGLDQNNDIAQISSHNYIGGATQPGVTLAGTLMNHTSTVTSVDKQVAEKVALSSYNLPFILGETNSLYNEGAPGLSNSFGAALWGVDFNLYCASQNISRVFMHQGTDYRYASWQPIETNKTTLGTKAPYYGNIAVAAMMGDLSVDSVQIEHIPQENEKDATYAAYVNGTLARVMAINMRQYNYTDSDTSSRSNKTYTFTAPVACKGDAVVEYLSANGSDAITGITWAGYSYNQELANGKPVRLNNVTSSETLPVGSDGELDVMVPDSAAAIVNLDCGEG